MLFYGKRRFVSRGADDGVNTTISNVRTALSSRTALCWCCDVGKPVIIAVALFCIPVHKACILKYIM